MPRGQERLQEEGFKRSLPSEMVTCLECKGHGHVKKECPMYLKVKSKVFATTLSDSDGSNSDSEESYDEEGNYSTFMTIAPVDSSKDLSLLVEELGEHTEVESMGIREESDDEDEGTNCKNLIICFLRKPESMLEWLRQPLEK